MDETAEKLAEVQALIGRLQPGEMLIFDGDAYLEHCFYARIILGPSHRDNQWLERVWLGDSIDAAQDMVDAMIERGELVETEYCSHWELPEKDQPENDPGRERSR
jgi:hypothetical protein